MAIQIIMNINCAYIVSIVVSQLTKVASHCKLQGCNITISQPPLEAQKHGLKVVLSLHFFTQIQSELPDFHLDTSHEVKLCFALGVSFRHIGKNKEAKEVLEKALKVCNDATATKEGAQVAKELGWIYQ